MYKRTFKFATKPAFKKHHKLLEQIMIDNGNINISACKKANRITIETETAFDAFKAWREIGKTPIEYYQLSV